MSLEWFLYYVNSAGLPLVVIAIVLWWSRVGVKFRAEQALRAETAIDLQRRTVALLEEIRNNSMPGKS